MSDFNENKFDREIRSLLDGVGEEVPDRVWEALSQRLDNMESARKRKAVLPWLRYGSAVAVAAAIALGVFFGIREPGSHFNADTLPLARNIISGSYAGASVLQTPALADAGKPEDLILPDTRRKDVTGNTVLPESGTVTEQTEVQTGQEQTEIQTETPVITEGSTKTEDKDRTISEQINESASGTFLADVWEDESDKGQGGRKIRAALTLSGVASSNSASAGRASGGTSRPMMSVMRPDRNGNAISENGNSTNYGIPLSFGIGAKIIFTPRWSLGVGINYSMLSRTFSGTYTTYSSDGSPIATPYSKIRNMQSYIGIPVNAYFSIVKSKAVDFYAYAGGTVEKCIINRYRMGDAGSAIYNEKVDGFQFSANAGLGVEFIIADMLGIYIDPSIRYYFPDSRQPKSIRTIQPLTLGFEMGFRVRL